MKIVKINSLGCPSCIIMNKVFNQIKDLDFHSDIIADIKLYNNLEKQIQASGFINIDNIFEPYFIPSYDNKHHYLSQNTKATC